MWVFKWPRRRSHNWNLRRKMFTNRWFMVVNTIHAMLCSLIIRNIFYSFDFLVNSRLFVINKPEFISLFFPSFLLPLSSFLSSISTFHFFCCLNNINSVRGKMTTMLIAMAKCFYSELFLFKNLCHENKFFLTVKNSQCLEMEV